MPDRIDFKELAEAVDIMEVAAFAGLRVKDERAACPNCKRAGDRAIELLPETNSFRCHAADAPPGKKVLAGDCIALYAHVCGYAGMYRAAKELQEHFGSARRTAPATTPQKGNRSHPPAFHAAAIAGIKGSVRLARAAATREQA